MQEYWEVYVKAIDGHKAMVSFNASVGDGVPNYEYGCVGFVNVELKNVKENGLAIKDEFDDIGFIEDRLEMESLRWRSGKYIGRIISQGKVNFIYALKLDFEWSNTVVTAMEYFPEYKYTYGSKQDMEWDLYQKLLFPTLRQWQIIANHHACDNLKEQGDNISIERAIEHKAYFYSLEDRENFEKQIASHNFLKQKENEKTFRGKTVYGVGFYRIDKPFYYDIDNITMQIIDICENCGGNYDGWESSLVKV